jgi:hypothetical protein
MSAFRDAITSLDPALYWALDSDTKAKDLSGNGRDGTPKGTIALGGHESSPIFGESTSTEFSGSGQYIDSGYKPFSNGTVRTIGCWAWRDTTGRDALWGSDSSPFTSFEIGDPEGTVDDLILSPNWGVNQARYADAWPGTGEWVFVVVTFDEGNDAVEVWLNGASIGVMTNVGQYTNGKNLRVGAWDLVGGIELDGRMAHFFVIEGALPGGVISDLYFLGVAGKIPATGVAPQGGSIRVVSISNRGFGAGYELNDDIEGLSWSSINPGGDEVCTFTLKRSWFSDLPEIARGNLLRVMDGVDVLWQGRIEDTDRTGESTEEIAVTAYGLGARLKDSTLQVVYVDSDLGNWTELSSSWRLGWGGSFSHAGYSVAPDAGNGRPALVLEISGAWGAQIPTAAAMYDAGDGLLIGQVYYDFVLSTADGLWLLRPGVADTDAPSGFAALGDLATGAASGSGTLTPIPPRRVFSWEWRHSQSGNGADGAQFRAHIRHLKVFGDHGLTIQGSPPNHGFHISQMVRDAVERATGIQVRRVDDTTFVCEQAAFREPTKTEDGIAELNRFEAHHRTWGTWGPDSPLDVSADGYFDYVETATQPNWVVFREECEGSPNLRSEMSTLFDTIHVRYTDSSRVPRTVTRSRDVPELNGIPREETIDGGTLTKAGAEALADAILALSSGFAPARGQISVCRPIRHVTRGKLPAHYLRADGSALRIPDILPSASLFALDETPDRRTTFPIKRVSVDASSKARPVATAELDQTNDTISALQARQAQSAQVRGG